ASRPGGPLRRSNPGRAIRNLDLGISRGLVRRFPWPLKKETTPVSSMFNDFASGLKAFEAPIDARLAVIRRTYLRLAGAVGLVVSSAWVLHAGAFDAAIAQWMYGTRWGLLLAVAGLVGVSLAGSAMAHAARRPAMQYAGLTIYGIGL